VEAGPAVTDAPAAVTDLYYHPDAQAIAQPFAGVFRLECRDAAPRDHPGFHLWAVDDHLELRRGDARHGAWVPAAEVARRAAQGGALRRACLARDSRPTLLDAMAGWGVDGLVLAAAGAAVTQVERHPALWALAQDLARRHGSAIRTRCADAFVVLSGPEQWDVVYLDPMFPARGKTALPGKRMQWAAELTAEDPRPLAEWLEAARQRAHDRVVLKRRRKDPLIGTPDWQIVGTTVRYDVYRGRAAR